MKTNVRAGWWHHKSGHHSFLSACPLCGLLQPRNKSRQNFVNLGRERMISIYNYVNDDILAKRGWHKTNLILIAMGFLAFLLLFSFMVQEIWLAEMWTWVVIDHHSSMIRVISNKYWWGYDNLDLTERADEMRMSINEAPICILMFCFALPKMEKRVPL